jgi:hypothetical protein
METKYLFAIKKALILNLFKFLGKRIIEFRNKMKIRFFSRNEIEY